VCWSDCWIAGAGQKYLSAYNKKARCGGLRSMELRYGPAEYNSVVRTKVNRNGAMNCSCV
jgi:hypothetical protein